jgi:hypothetical protein
MRMVNRASARKAVALSAVVSCARFGLIRGTILDLSEGGLYVEAETSIVPIGAPVSVTFDPCCARRDGSITIKGTVRHQSLQGFGIAFECLEPHCREVLQHFLAGRPAVTEYAYPALRAV